MRVLTWRRVWSMDETSMAMDHAIFNLSRNPEIAGIAAPWSSPYGPCWPLIPTLFHLNIYIPGKSNEKNLSTEQIAQEAQTWFSCAYVHSRRQGGNTETP